MVTEILNNTKINMFTLIYPNGSISTLIVRSVADYKLHIDLKNYNMNTIRNRKTNGIYLYRISVTDFEAKIKETIYSLTKW